MKNNKGFAPIVIVLIIVAILVVGGVTYYMRAKNNTNYENSYNPTNSIQVKTQENVEDNVSPTPANKSTKLTSFSGSKGVFFAESYGLTEVDVYFILPF